MEQAIQVMLWSSLIAVAVGFLISFVIRLLTRLLSIGNKKETIDDDAETALAVALALKASLEPRKPNENQK